MEFKQEKPVHLRCPRCGHDFACNTNHIEEKIDNLKKDISSIMAQMQTFKGEYPGKYKNDVWYKKARAALARKQDELVDAKKARKAVNTEFEKQVNNIFFQLVCEKIGKEEAIRLKEEAEKQMVYYDYDMATQTYTRFDGA